MRKKLPRCSPFTYRKTGFKGEASKLALIQFSLNCLWDNQVEMSHRHLSTGLCEMHKTDLRALSWGVFIFPFLTFTEENRLPFLWRSSIRNAQSAISICVPSVIVAQALPFPPLFYLSFSDTGPCALDVSLSVSHWVILWDRSSAQWECLGPLAVPPVNGWVHSI